MATIELLIAFLSCPPGENAHAPLCQRHQERRERVSTKVKLQYSNLIKTITQVPARGQPRIVHYVLHHVLLHVNHGCDAVISTSTFLIDKSVSIKGA